MTVVNLTPAGTVSNTGAVSGAGSAHAALADLYDGSYVEYDSAEFSRISLSDLALPGGARIKAAFIYSRCAAPIGGPCQMATRPFVPSGPQATSVVAVTWTTPSDVGSSGWPTAPSDADLDGLEVQIGTGGDVSKKLNVYGFAVVVTYVTKPTVAVNAPSGTVTDTNGPEVTWTSTLDSDGGAQTRYETKIFTAAQYGAGGFDPDTSDAFDGSGAVASSDTRWMPGVTQPDGAYRAYVRVAQTVLGASHWSAWSYGDYDIDVNRPGVPIVDLTPEPDTGSVTIELTDTAGDNATKALEVQRYDDTRGWVTIRTLRDDGLTVSGGTTLVEDFEAPLGVAVAYRARALTEFGTVIFIASDWSEPETTEIETRSWWLKHPLLPGLNVPLDISSFGTVQRPARRGVIQALGALNPIVISDTPGGETGTVTVTVRDRTARALLQRILSTRDTLFLQGPYQDDEPDRYVNFDGYDVTRLADKAFVHDRLIPLPFVVVASPAGAVIEWPPGVGPYTPPVFPSPDLLI